MASTRQTNLRLSPHIKAAAVAAAEGRGVSLARLVEMALSAYLGTIPDDTGGMVPHDPILHRIEAIERRLTALEGDTAPIPDSTAPAPAPAPPPASPAKGGGQSKRRALIAAGLVASMNAASNYKRDHGIEPDQALRGRGWRPGDEPPGAKTLWYPPDGGQ